MATTEINALQLDKVMDDIGMTEEVTQFRRHIQLLIELIHPFFLPVLLCANHIFGSQSEGSTTIGMNSDVDFIVHSIKNIACLHLSECSSSEFNPWVLVVRDTFSFPQCCSLQLLIKDSNGDPVPVSEENMDEEVKSLIGHDYILDKLGRVLVFSITDEMDPSHSIWTKGDAQSDTTWSCNFFELLGWTICWGWTIC
ncbi:hypothetical protein DPMN_151779 [Dreissena polymorpha]|uniref:Uncharacterized protein n=1 Tax=Dreissena polymorpha TaxID=45954 RepID=A0A9D4FG04_DREPO|nr:hypothetical protein DPMN_151779 [Dreissena polymorpha]